MVIETKFSFKELIGYERGSYVDRPFKGRRVSITTGFSETVEWYPAQPRGRGQGRFLK